MNMTSHTFHPKWHRARISTYWWLERWAYLKFILREVSSVFVACFVVMTLLQIRALGQGPESYLQFEERMRSPFWITLNVISLLFVLYHAITWFNLAPKAMEVRMGGKRVPDILIAGSNYAAWLVVSAAIAWIVLGGQ